GMSQVEKSAVKSLLSMHRTYAELDEYMEAQLKEAGYAGVDIQKNPLGTRITVFVTRPGLAIGRRGTGIKELTERVAQRFNLQNPQIAVSEVEQPELNPRIMAQRTAQIVARGTAFRRAANWTMTTIMEAGAMGVEIGVAGKLRSDRAHKEKYRMGVVPKSGESADQIVRSATTDVLMKLGLFGIKVKIAIKDALPPPIEFAPDAAPGEGQPTMGLTPTAPGPDMMMAAATVAPQTPMAAPAAVAAPAPKVEMAPVAPQPPALEAEVTAPKAKKEAKPKAAKKTTRKRATKKETEAEAPEATKAEEKTETAEVKVEEQIAKTES
ncbi:MAG: 30S ribosomal protein S3, partial [Thaumarchaeota archaeon]|nr:30S ribosomal protein S3 [Nitrososphaerota archaeon]